MIVMKKHRARRSFFSLQCGDRRSIQQINIQPAVVVVIDERHARTGRFDDGFLFRAARAMVKFVQPDLLGYVRENHRRAIDKSARGDRPGLGIFDRRMSAGSGDARRLHRRWRFRRRSSGLLPAGCRKKRQ